MEATFAASYDEVPYDSVPASGGHPSRLAAMAAVLGLPPPPVERCRVLELGCGVGANALPLAADLPHAEVVAIDLSARQIELARAMASRLELTNVDFRQLDILAVGPDLGQFDYVIAHGIYSWVPAEVRDRVLAICGERLTPSGLAYVSYSTLPGWQFTGMIRDFLMFHLRDAATPAAREGGLVDGFAMWIDGVTADADPRAAFMREYIQEYEHTLDRAGAYRAAAIHHDILAPVNHAVHLQDFVAHAARHGLAYVTDAVRWAALPASFTSELRGRLAGLTDPIEREQYLDFLTMRSMRSTVLSRAGGPAPTARPEHLRGLAISSLLRPVASRPELLGPRPERFANGGVEVRIDTGLAKAALVHLARVAPRAIDFDQLVAAARGLLGRPAIADQGALGPDALELARTLLGLATGERSPVFLWATPPPVTAAVDGTPRGRPLARAQLDVTRTVTNHYHQPVTLDDAQAAVLALLDGTRDRAAVLEQLLEAHASKRLARPGRPVSGHQQRAIVSRELDSHLADLAAMALLSAPV